VSRAPLIFANSYDPQGVVGWIVIIGWRRGVKEYIVLLFEETTVPGENQRPATSH
jgi:hypothetical protein